MLLQKEFIEEDSNGTEYIYYDKFIMIAPQENSSSGDNNRFMNVMNKP